MWARVGATGPQSAVKEKTEPTFKSSCQKQKGRRIHRDGKVVDITCWLEAPLLFFSSIAILFIYYSYHYYINLGVRQRCMNRFYVQYIILEKKKKLKA